MSTKIFNAGLSENSLIETKNIILNLREAFQKKVQEAFLLEAASCSLVNSDRAFLASKFPDYFKEGFIPNPSPLEYQLNYMLEDVRESYDINKYCYFDMSMKAQLYPHPDDEGKTLFVLFSDSQDLVSYLIEKSGSLPYSYSNGVDQIDGVSHEDWSKRGEIWERALSGGPSFSDSGIPLEVLSREDFLKLIQDLMLNLPEEKTFSKIKSLNRRAENVTFLSVLGEIPPSVQERVLKGEFSAYMRFERERREEKEFKDVVELFRGCLNDEVSIKELLSKPPHSLKKSAPSI